MTLIIIVIFFKKKREEEEIESEMDLIELEPLIIRRIENSFNIGFSLARKRGVGENKIQFIEHRFRPFCGELFPDDFGAGAESMEAQQSQFRSTFYLSHLSIQFLLFSLSLKLLWLSKSDSFAVLYIIYITCWTIECERHWIGIEAADAMDGAGLDTETSMRVYCPHVKNTLIFLF